MSLSSTKQDRQPLPQTRECYACAAVGFLDWQANGTLSGDVATKRDIGKYILSAVQSMGITGYSDEINAGYRGNLIQVISSKMDKNKTNKFVSYAKNRGNRLVVYVRSGGKFEAIDDIMYESVDQTYVVLMVFAPTADYPETGTFCINVNTGKMTKYA